MVFTFTKFSHKTPTEVVQGKVAKLCPAPGDTNLDLGQSFTTLLKLCSSAANDGSFFSRA